jgi:hypothetical protein
MMKRILMGVLLGLILLSVVSADSVPIVAVKGNITYSGDTNNLIPGADVVVVCNGNTLRATSSNSWGYRVTFFDYQCPEGSMVNVTATKNGLSGSNTGIVQQGGVVPWLNVAIINVSINVVPEFGMIAGTMTVLSALAVFFVIRRK